MADPDTSARRNLPSVDAVMRGEAAQAAAARFGRQAVAQAVRGELAALRRHGLGTDADGAAALAQARLEAEDAPLLRPVFNLTGTVLHTNLGRAPLRRKPPSRRPPRRSASAATLEYDLATGRRGDRDDHSRGLLRELTGAEDATVVNNNAAAVLLVLNTLADGRERHRVARRTDRDRRRLSACPRSWRRAGARLREVGTTNRTHLATTRGAGAEDRRW